MENRVTLLFALLICSATIAVRSEFYSESSHRFQLKEKVTHIQFYLFDILSGDKPSAVEVARANTTGGGGSKSATPFGSVYAIDDALREGPNADSKVIGNARGLYVSSSQDDKLTLVMYADFGFTTGKLNGSSISVFSRNPVTEVKRELAVVGGRGKFRLARGFARVRTHYLNTTNGDAILQYKVTVVHY